MNEKSVVALEILKTAGCADEINAGCALLGQSVGLPNYFFVQRRTLGRVGLVGHNAGSSQFIASMPLELGSSDPIARLATQITAPLRWGEDDFAGLSPDVNAAYRLRAAHGFRSGFASHMGDYVTHSVTLVLAHDQAAAPPADIGIVGGLLLGNTYLLDVVQRCTPPLHTTSDLTPRELECLHYVLAGASAKETAKALNIGARSVNQYLERARKRLAADSSFQAAILAADLGLISVIKARDLRTSVAPNVR